MDKPDMNLVKLIEDYGSEDKCRAFLEDLRWPDGVRCPRCGTDLYMPDPVEVHRPAE